MSKRNACECCGHAAKGRFCETCKGWLTDTARQWAADHPNRGQR